jgi:integrase
MLRLTLMRVERMDTWMRQQGQKTRYPGVYRTGDNQYRVRVVALDPRTGKKKALEKLYDGLSAQEAARLRAELLAEIHAATEAPVRQRVSDFAKSWIASKAVSLDAGTARTYAAALEDHVLPVLGDFWYDALTKADVQKWVDESFKRTWKTKSGAARSYRRAAVHGWFRVFRAMTRDAIEAFGLLRDPCLRVRFPQEELPEDSNALSPTELAAFLSEMRASFPQHFALAAVLAFSGLRFCHASALKWDDWDEEQGLLRVRRKQVRGEVSAVTKKKRAPGVIPVEPALAEILREQRTRLEAAGPLLCKGGWMFPSEVGTLRTPNSMDKAWKKCLKAAKVRRRVTLHGLRYTFTDLIRLSKADAVVRRALTGHVTREMQDHYSHVGTEEKRAAIAGALKLVVITKEAKNGEQTPESVNSGVNWGSSPVQGLTGN